MAAVPMMPFYLCLDGTVAADSTAALRSLVSEVATRTSQTELPEAVRLGIVAFGRQPDLAVSLADIEYPAAVPVLDREGPTELASLFQWLEGLIAHDVGFFKANSIPVLRPIVFLVLGSQSSGVYDTEWFDHLVGSAPVCPVVVTLGFGQADPAVVSRFQTGGSLFALPDTSANQVAAIGRCLVESIIGTAQQIVNGSPTLTLPTSTVGLGPVTS